MHGQTYKGKKCGSFGDISIFSFYPNKHITTGEGGMVTTNDPDLAERLRQFRSHGIVRKPEHGAWYYEIAYLGYNYRMSNVLAGIGRGQMQVLNDRVQARRRNFEYYQANLGDLPGIGWQPESEGSFSNRWLTCLTLDPTVSGGLTREDLRLELEKDNIEGH